MSVAEECVRLTVKLTPEEREIAHLLPYVSTARYVGRYGWVTAELKDVAERHASGRMVSMLEGGYALSALGRSAVQHIKVMAGLT